MLLPWLVVDEPDLFASNLMRDWVGSLQQLGLTHLSERLDELAGREAARGARAGRLLYLR